MPRKANVVEYALLCRASLDPEPNIGLIVDIESVLSKSLWMYKSLIRIDYLLGFVDYHGLNNILYILTKIKYTR